MPSSLERNNVLRRLEDLKRADPHHQVHGSAAHLFELNPPISHGEMAAFESKHRVVLPEDYRHFITAIGNGGAGPSYGLFRFGEQDDGHGVCSWDKAALVGDFSAEYRFEGAWNLPESFWAKRPDLGPDVSEEEEDRLTEAWDKELDEHYWNPEMMNGAIPICHRGCALRQWLVIHGKQRGSVWNDDRVDENGISPLRDQAGNRVSFTCWYLSWLRNPHGS